MAGGRMSGGGTAELVTVRLLGLPLRVHARAQQQAESMQREFQLIVEQAREDAGSVPGRLLELSTVLSARYEGFSEEQEERIEAATAANELQLPELVFQLPAHAGEAAQQLAKILDEADEFCREGQLLTLAATPDVVAYRRWYLDNFISQCAGGSPIGWDGPLL
jgi:hypothetical protein